MSLKDLIAKKSAVFPDKTQEQVENEFEDYNYEQEHPESKTSFDPNHPALKRLADRTLAQMSGVGSVEAKGTKSLLDIIKEAAAKREGEMVARGLNPAVEEASQIGSKSMYSPAALKEAQTGYKAVQPGEFKEALTEAAKSNPNISKAVSNYTPEELKNMNLKLNPNRASGYGIKDQNELVNVFSKEKGKGPEMVDQAVKEGARKLDHFDIKRLNELYGNKGFEEVAREPNWTPGEPDVVFRQLKNPPIPEGRAATLSDVMPQIQERGKSVNIRPENPQTSDDLRQAIKNAVARSNIKQETNQTPNFIEQMGLKHPSEELHSKIASPNKGLTTEEEVTKPPVPEGSEIPDTPFGTEPMENMSKEELQQVVNTIKEHLNQRSK